ncbi:hypothetical protein PSFL_26660 [Pseudomonas sp. DD1]|nr:Uncharacterised protein [Pseudomonas fluorescens]
MSDTHHFLPGQYLGARLHHLAQRFSWHQSVNKLTVQTCRQLTQLGECDAIIGFGLLRLLQRRKGNAKQGCLGPQRSAQ